MSDAIAGVLVVVTGSRDWPDRDRVFRVLDAAAKKHEEIAPYAPLRVMEGGCAKGADLHAREWIARRYRAGLDHREPMPAPFKREGRSAGPRRNRYMALVAEARRFCGWKVWCVSFGLSMSTGGTSQCVAMLRAKDLAVREVELE